MLFDERRINRELNRKLVELAGNTKEFAESITPVDTGFMKANWYLKPDLRNNAADSTVYLANRAPYAYYVSEGSTRFRGYKILDRIKTILWRTVI